MLDDKHYKRYLIGCGLMVIGAIILAASANAELYWQSLVGALFTSFAGLIAGNAIWGKS